jgi:hypothetical protein
MIALRERPAPDAGRQCGFQLPAFGAAQPLHLQAEPLLEAVELFYRGVLIGVARDAERAGSHVSGGETRDLLEFRHERWVAPRRVEVELEKGLLAVVDLGHRCQESRGDPRCSPSRRVVGQHDRGSRCGETPRDGKPDDTAAHDHDVGFIQEE